MYPTHLSKVCHEIKRSINSNKACTIHPIQFYHEQPCSQNNSAHDTRRRCLTTPKRHVEGIVACNTE